VGISAASDMPNPSKSAPCGLESLPCHSSIG
jgi:hypothetical protein